LRMSKLRPGRALSLSRGRWCAPGRRLSSGRHPPLSCGQSLRPRWNNPSAGGHFHETSTRVQAIHPSPQIRLATGPKPGTRRFPPVFSSPAAPGWNKSSFGFYPGLRTPQLPAAHARAETGQRALARVTRPRHQPDLQRRLPLELMHPHVARSRPSPPSPPGSPPSRPASLPATPARPGWCRRSWFPAGGGPPWCHSAPGW